jgi:hypothetical protein
LGAADMKKYLEMEQKLRDILARRRMEFSSVPFDYPIMAFDVGSTSLNINDAQITYVLLKTPTWDLIISHPDEKSMLLFALKILKKYMYGSILGFNIAQFDIPLFRNRLKYHNINLPFYFKYVLDLRTILTNGDEFMRGTLEEFASALGMKEVKDGWSKSDYELLWQDPTMESLRKFLLFDVEACYNIFLYLKGETNEEVNSLPKMWQQTLCQKW